MIIERTQRNATAMLRFFSKRHKPRRDQKAGALERYGNLRAAGAEGGPPPPGRAATAATGPLSSKERERMRKLNKHNLECRVILLDGADLPVTITVGEQSIAIDRYECHLIIRRVIIFYETGGFKG